MNDMYGSRQTNLVSLLKYDIVFPRVPLILKDKIGSYEYFSVKLKLKYEIFIVFNKNKTELFHVKNSILLVHHKTQDTMLPFLLARRRYAT